MKVELQPIQLVFDSGERLCIWYANQHHVRDAAPAQVRIKIDESEIGGSMEGRMNRLNHLLLNRQILPNEHENLMGIEVQ